MHEYSGRRCTECQRANIARWWRSEKGKAQNRVYRQRYMQKPEYAANVKALERGRVFTETDRERYRINARRWAREHPEQHAEHVNRRRALKSAAVGSHTTAEWDAIKKRQHGRCAHCSQRLSLTRDHRIPLSRGGTDFAYNIQGLCKPCNSAKSTKIESGSQHSLFDGAAIAS